GRTVTGVQTCALPICHCSAGPAIRDGDRPFEPMNQGTHPEELPAEVLNDVASVVGAEVTLLSRLPGGDSEGAMGVQLAGRANARSEERRVGRGVYCWT